MILAAVTTMGGAASAQGIAIDDDGWSFIDRTQKLDYVAVIDDDGWSRAEKPAYRLSASRGAGSPCIQLERALGMSGSECGRMSISELTREYLESHN